MAAAEEMGEGVTIPHCPRGDPSVCQNSHSVPFLGKKLSLKYDLN